MELELLNVNEATAESEVLSGGNPVEQLAELQLALVGGGIGNCELG